MAAPRSLLLSSSPTISDAATRYTASTGECGDLGICGKVALLDDLISAGNSDDGIVTPRALAAFKFITSSILVGCSTGSCFGATPLRMRPAYTPTWWYISARLVP